MPKSWVISWQSQFDHLKLPGPFVNIGGLWQLESDEMKASLSWISARNANIYLQSHTGLSRSLRESLLFLSALLQESSTRVPSGEEDQLPPPFRQGTEASAKPFYLNQQLSRWSYNVLLIPVKSKTAGGEIYGVSLWFSFRNSHVRNNGSAIVGNTCLPSR